MKTLFDYILNHYLTEKKISFRDNELARYIRGKPCEIINQEACIDKKYTSLIVLLEKVVNERIKINGEKYPISTSKGITVKYNKKVYLTIINRILDYIFKIQLNILSKTLIEKY